MCIRDSLKYFIQREVAYLDKNVRLTDGTSTLTTSSMEYNRCLLYTSDAADERSSVDLGGRRIIKKKKQYNITFISVDTHIT